MGRRAKYATNEERQRAARKRKASYAQTERAKELRVEQNRRAYIRRLEVQKLKQAAELILPHIPDRIHRLHEKDIPWEAISFRHAYRSDILLEENEDYAQFLYLPPYRISEDLKDVGRARAALYTQGKREKALRRSEEERVAQYQRSTPTDFRVALHAEIVRRVDTWPNLCISVSQGSTGSCAWNKHMGADLLQWEAREIVRLVEEFEAVSGDEDRFISLILSRWEGANATLRRLDHSYS